MAGQGPQSASSGDDARGVAAPAAAAASGRARVPADPVAGSAQRHQDLPGAVGRIPSSATGRPSVSALRPVTLPAGRRRGSKVIMGLLAVVTGVAGSAAFLGAPVVAARLFGPTPVWQPGRAVEPLAPVLAAPADTAPTPTPGALSAILGPLVAAPGVGGHAAVSVVDVATGQSLYSGQDTASTPASTAKLVTAVTVLAARGPTYRLATRVMAGRSDGEVVLVGGGDPTVTAGPNGTYPGAARLDELAARATAALGSTAPTRVVYDTSLFTGDQLGPGWDADIPTGGFGAPVVALTMDGARVDPRQTRGKATRTDRPDLATAQAFARALGLPASAVVAGTAAPDARELARVESPPLARIVEIMLAESDNVIAESLARQVAIARNQPGSFAGAAAAMRSVLGELSLPTDQFGLVDGSGLSRNDRLSAGLLTAVLTAAARHENDRLHAVFSGLPVAGYSGTLQERFRTAGAGGSAAGSARAKTGTLNGISAIAGIVTDADGRTLAFAILADAVTKGTPAAQEALDRIVAALAGCGCR